jgi:citrate synthase
MPDTARLIIDGRSHDLPIVVGTEGDRAIDITGLRDAIGHVTLDEGYANTGSCESAITFVDGEKGILRYRGIPIEQLAARSTFVETCWLLIYGELPTREQLKAWSALFTKHEMIHEGLYHHFDGFPSTGHPMAILSAMINAMSCYDTGLMEMEIPATFQVSAARLISKLRTISAAAYKASIGQPIIYPKPHLDYCTNFLHMMFSIPFKDYEPDPDVVAALQLVLILHADHEQNSSSSTVRMVASTGANLFASCAAGVCALWGPLHGGANAAVVEMLQQLHDDSVDLKDYVARVKDKNSSLRLMGFGHRLYKSYDPRASIMRDMADKLIT